MRIGVSIAAGAVVLAAAVPAEATTASVGPGGLAVSAHPGEANLLTIVKRGIDYVVTDGAGKLVAGAGCERITRTSARCPVPATTPAVSIETFDGNDAVSVVTPDADVVVQSGDGRDVVLVDRSSSARRSTSIDLGSGPDVLDLVSAPCSVQVPSVYSCNSVTEATEVAGGDGADTLRVGGAPRLVVGGPGDDAIELTDSPWNSEVHGGSGDDSISAAGVVHGDDGNDVMTWSTPKYVFPQWTVDQPPYYHLPPNRPWYGGAGDDEINRDRDFTDDDVYVTYVIAYCGEGDDVLNDDLGYAYDCERRA